MKKFFVILFAIIVFMFISGCKLIHTHNYNSTLSYPTCTEKGYEMHSCECGDVYYDNYVDELGHSVDDWTILKDATNSSTGIKQGLCKKCGKLINEETPINLYPNLNGYEIKICLLGTQLDLFNEFTYLKTDSKYSSVLEEVEHLFNCKFVFDDFNSDTWAGVEMTYYSYLNTQASMKNSDYDIYSISDHKLYQLVESNMIIDVTDYYKKYGNNMTNDIYYLSGTYKNKLYTINNNNVLLPNVLYYNMTLYDQLHKVDPSLMEPAKIFNDKYWTFSTFKDYCIQVQQAMEKLYGEEGAAGNDNQQYYAVSGWDSYYWAGLSSDYSEPIIDLENKTINLNTAKKNDAINLVKFLFDNNLFDPNQNVEHVVTSWNEGRSLFNVGEIWYVGRDNKWPQNLWGEDTRYCYVPWPRHDSLDFESMKIAISGSKYTYAMSNYRDYSSYGENCTSENIYRAFVTLLQRIKEYDENNDDHSSIYIPSTKYTQSHESAITYNYIQDIINNGQCYYEPFSHYNNPIGSTYTNNVNRETIKGAVTQFCATKKVQTWDEAIRNLIPILKKSLELYLNGPEA